VGANYSQVDHIEWRWPTVSDESPSSWRIGPFQIDAKVSVSGVFAILMAFVAMVGGWYKFDYRVSAVEARETNIETQEESDKQLHERLGYTLDRLDRTISGVVQALDDKNIHVVVRDDPH
jgi:hypothetical protein